MRTLRILLAVMMMLTVYAGMTSSVSAQTITHVKTKDGYVVIYGYTGQVEANISIKQKTKVVGWSERLLILSVDGYYMIYDALGNLKKTVSTGYIGRITHVFDEGFNSVKNGYIYRWEYKYDRDLNHPKIIGSA